MFSSQIPTGLIVTSNESVSSIDTQFGSLCDELAQNLNSINLLIEEKKCANFKLAIAHLQNKLKVALGLTTEAEREEGLISELKNTQAAQGIRLLEDIEEDESEGDENLMIYQDENSSDDDR